VVSLLHWCLDMSSDDEQSGASSEGEDVGTTGLIATRAKRSTAGNLYASLLAKIDDEDFQKELGSDGEEDEAADYEESDKGYDEDDALESSGGEEDAGPPQEGQAEDMTGEKDLKKIERKEQRQKRKAKDARLKLPAWHQKKKVKLADDVKMEDAAPAERPKKKSERANWLPTPADAPTRQSHRSLAVANREVTHANLKQSYERSERQRRVMKDAAEREKTKKRANLTQEERLKVCEKIERQTAKEFGRWEREEAERQRVRDEMLAAKRQKRLEGPVVKTWSGSAVWAGLRMVEDRCEHGSRDVNVKDELKKLGSGEGTADEGAVDRTHGTGCETSERPSIPSGMEDSAPSLPPSISVIETQARSTPDSVAASTSAHDPTPVPWLQGIHDYASQTPPNVPSPMTDSPRPAQTVAPSVLIAPTDVAAPQPRQAFQQLPSVLQAPGQHYQVPDVPSLPPQQQPYGGWPPGGVPAHAIQVQPVVAPSTLPPPPPPVPVIREQAQRSLVILEQFEGLEKSATSKRSTKSINASLEPTATASILLPDSHPTFTPEESKYLLAKQRRPRVNADSLMPPAPPKPLCAITTWDAKYRDPKTGLCYADVHIYKMIQRLLAGGCRWSGLLGCWVGPAYGKMGRPARGVPEGFARSPAPVMLVVEGKREDVVERST